MFSLKLFVVFLAVCICVSQEIYGPCSENNTTPCLCEAMTVSQSTVTTVTKTTTTMINKLH
uniref:Hirudin-like factor X n=1 Tax=Hirudo medicinalis TaxID=6421 RepID=A0A0K2DR32_HIRME|nr:hirudin-like factor X [Hirudo medicinalis]